MKLNFIKIFSCIVLLSTITACSVEEEQPFDSPFVYLTDRFGGQSAQMDSEAKFTATYYLRLSSKTRTENLSVEYDIIVGDGLQDGKDYTLDATTASPIIFEPGVYEKIIKINWLPNELDEQKDNTLTIQLSSTNDNSVTIGKIGPNKLGSTYVIKKE